MQSCKYVGLSAVAPPVPSTNSHACISALIRDDSKIQRVQGTSTKPIIYMFTAAGREMTAVRVSK